MTQLLEGQPTTSPVQTVVHLLRAIRYHKAYLVTSLIVAGLLGSVYFFTATRIYEANASILITKSNSGVWSDPSSSDEGRNGLVPTYEMLFSSKVVLERAIKTLQQKPPSARIDLAAHRRDLWVDILRNNLTAKGVRNTNIIQLSYRSQAPEAATEVVAAILDSYMSFMEKHHKDVSIEIMTILETEMKDNEKRLREKQAELLAQKSAAGEISLDEGGNHVHPIVERVIELNKSLLSAGKKRIQLHSSLVAVRAAIQNGGDLRQHLIAFEPEVGQEVIMSSLGMNPQLAAAADKEERELRGYRIELNRLRPHLGPTHHEIVLLHQKILAAEQYLQDYYAKINNRQQTMGRSQLGPLLVTMIQERLAQTTAHENELRQQYEAFKAEALQLNDRQAQLQMVTNEVGRLQNYHNTLLNRIANIDMGQDNTGVRVAVVSDPTAIKGPVAPRLSIIGMLSLLSGLGIGVSIVYVLDLLDDRFSSPQELSEHLGVPVLAIVKKLIANGDEDARLLPTYDDPLSVESEAFRTLRTTLTLSSQDTQRVAITSYEPADGKTTVLANLAVSYAQANKRTLLIDADLRRPGLTKFFNVRGCEGLAEILRSDESIALMAPARLQPTGVDGLDILPCGTRPPNPSELLSESRLAEIVAWAETRYDQIFIDCPPILAVSDAAMVARHTDGMLLVVRPDKNHRRRVIQSAEALASLDVNLLGVVANRVDNKKNGGYYDYAYGYGGEYHYVENEEQDAPPPPATEPRRRRAA